MNIRVEFMNTGIEKELLLRRKLSERKQFYHSLHRPILLKKQIYKIRYEK